MLKSMSQFSSELQAQSILDTKIYERPRVGNTARSYTGPVSVVREKGGKPQQDDTGFIDSRCSRHMTGNIAYLLDFKKLDRGYVTFGGGEHGGERNTELLYVQSSLNPITKPLFMLHIDLFGPTFVSSLMHKKYCLVVTDDYNRFSWVFFLTTKDETSGDFKILLKEIENPYDRKLKYIKSNNGIEFNNKVMDDFCKEKGIKREYSVARTPQQNGVAERRNRTLIEAARTMLADSKLPTTFWAEAVSIACYIQNRVYKENLMQVEAMQEELLQFKLQQVWILVDLLLERCNLDTMEDVSTKEVFALVARIEAIRLFLDYASFMGFLVYQMDVKSAFLYGAIEEEVYVTQPPRFKDPDHPDKVYKVVKALYGLHQAPRAWYETLANYLLGNGFKRGLQVQQKEDGIFISQDKYVVDILKKFKYTDVKSASTLVDLEKPLVKDEDADDIDVHIYRSMIGSLMYLIASRPDIMFAVCACARFQVTPKTSHLLAVKRIFRYLKGKPTLGLWYSRDSPFELVAYIDSDYAGATQDRKSTTRGCQFLGNRLISWQYKKQTVVATSITEAEYVAAASCYGQVLWIQNQLLDYGYNFMNTIINIDNNSTICIIENLVQHSKTNHIEIRHHFIRDCNAKKLIQMVKIHTDYNVVAFSKRVLMLEVSVLGLKVFGSLIP
ncbi:putative ribonuclease H-like domain-containing protein [Tanacetum coccineum]|uniref:Ribonuclease H-like domain-containing protein n=1 Tax=Tanacetum coccineum TaxID=301880 RepID=A0ABQ5HRH2_9ASTR